MSTAAAPAHAPARDYSQSPERRTAYFGGHPLHRSLAIVTGTRELVLAAGLALSLGCATDKTEPPASETPASGEATVNAQAEGNAKAELTVTPTLGGSVFAVGEYQTELAVFEDGLVKGLVFDARGQAVPPALVTNFTLLLSAEGDVKPRATLAWNADAKCFQGKADVLASLVAKPIDVSFDVGGKAQTGALAAYSLLPKLDLRAQADLNAEAKAEVPTPDVKTKLAAGAKVGNDTKAALSSKLGATAKAGADVKAAVAVPKPTVNVEVKKSASATAKPAAVKAKASAGFSFGSK